jgi:hypothetical protein
VGKKSDRRHEERVRAMQQEKTQEQLLSLVLEKQDAEITFGFRTAGRLANRVRISRI